MPLVSLKTENVPIACCDSPYGYGTEIRLDAAQVKALGLDVNPPAPGSSVGITAIAVVRRLEQSIEGEETKIDVCLCLQLTDMEVTGAATRPPLDLY